MSNKGVIAGIMSIISGVFGFIGLGYMILMVYLMRAMFAAPPFPGGAGAAGGFLRTITFFYLAVGIGLALLGIVGVVGGFFALTRKHWGIALAGAIAGAVTFSPTGIAAVIFTVMAEPEFKAGGSNTAGIQSFPGQEVPR
ncbi:MAG: hypothetical protein HY673_15240 [Chloroflexi bacterium]|nr:hypothetical protein [Chloroflexota bacterium]